MRFYDIKSQSRCIEIPKKSGDGMKAPTIKDAIEYNLVPSVTEILNVINKPYLLTWVEDRAFKFAWDSAQTGIQYDEAKDLYRKSSEEARDKGTELHDQMSRMEVNDFTSEAINWINERYVKIEHEVQFAHYVYGGTIDAICTTKDGEVDVLDFKFVMSDRKPRDSELWQLGAYKSYVDTTRKVRSCWNLLISQETGKLLTAHEWSASDLERGYHIFQTLLDVWQLTNNYNILRGKRYYD